MNKTDLIAKYEHRLTLKNYSDNTLRAYLSGLYIFLDYVKENQISAVTPKVLDTYFHYCKKELDYSYSMMKQLLNSFTNLKHKAIFTLCYSAGLRVGEILNLKVKDIDSDRMQIRILSG